ncbi:MAG: o-succinylbenzoate synthase [Pirellulaceae bacterium]|nr:o-succinylbenzoate synthase [Pirellulaceae bacterium]
MRINSIELFHVAIPRATSSATGSASATAVGPLETVLVRMQSGSTVGWGEASPGNGPHTSGEWAGGVFATLRRWLVPALVGRDVASAEQLREYLAPFKGNPFAKSALDTAWWDLAARLRGEPLHRMLDGVRETVELGVTLDPMDSLEAFLARAQRAADDGFSRIAMTFRPGWEISVLSALRDRLPLTPLHVDCGGTMRLEHMETLCRLDDFSLSMVAQPLAADDLVGHAMIQEAIHTPICLDESITSLEQADMAMELKSCQYVDLKPGRVGGLTPALAIHDLCREACVPCWVGAMPQTAIAARAGLALAAKENCTYPADHSPANEWFERDLAPPVETTLLNGRRVAPLWTEPGIGVEPDAELLEKCTLDRAAVGLS